MWRWGVVVLVAAGLVGCGGRDEESSSIRDAPPKAVPMPAPEPQEPAFVDPATREAESVAKAPKGAPRSVALRLTGTEWEEFRWYALNFGYAAACGIDVSSESSRVAAWIDRKFPLGSEGRGGVLIYFAKIMETGAQSQASNGHDCAFVQSRIDGTVWP